MPSDVSCPRCHNPIQLSADETSRNRDVLTEMDYLRRCDRCDQWMVLGFVDNQVQLVRAVTKGELKRHLILLCLAETILVVGLCMLSLAAVSSDVHWVLRLTSLAFAVASLLASTMVGLWIAAMFRTGRAR